MPSRLKNGTKLSSQEFHDALLLCCTRTPGDLPSSLCDGCGVEFCVRHALKCKVGGLVIMLRHRAQRDQLKELCNLASKALAPSAVCVELMIQNRHSAEETKVKKTAKPVVQCLMHSSNE
jgi:hypothetical protein